MTGRVETATTTTKVSDDKTDEQTAVKSPAIPNTVNRIFGFLAYGSEYEEHITPQSSSKSLFSVIVDGIEQEAGVEKRGEWRNVIMQRCDDLSAIPSRSNWGVVDSEEGKTNAATAFEELERLFNECNDEVCVNEDYLDKSLVPESVVKTMIKEYADHMAELNRMAELYHMAHMAELSQLFGRSLQLGTPSTAPGNEIKTVPSTTQLNKQRNTGWDDFELEEGRKVSDKDMERWGKWVNSLPEMGFENLSMFMSHLETDRKVPRWIQEFAAHDVVSEALQKIDNCWFMYQPRITDDLSTKPPVSEEDTLPQVFRFTGMGPASGKRGKTAEHGRGIKIRRTFRGEEDDDEEEESDDDETETVRGD